MSINRVVISGNLTRDPELRSTASGTAVLGFGVAVNDRRKNQQTGEWEDCPNFIDCTMFGARAEALSSLLAKGVKVSVEGKLRWSQWEREGQKRSKIEVIVDELDFLSGRNVDPSPRVGQSVDARHAAIPASISPDGASPLRDEDIPLEEREKGLPMHDMYLENVDDGVSKAYLVFKTASWVLIALMMITLLVKVASLGLLFATAERQVRTVPGFVASVETREEPVALWLGRRETTYVYLAFDDGHAIKVDSGSDEYASLAGCEEGDAVEVDRTDYVGGIVLDPEEAEPRYGNARLLR